MDFFVVFFVTLFVLLLLVGAMLFARTPIYRPDKKSTYQLISALCAGQSAEEKWLLFISINIVHDPDLEKIRLQCSELELNAADNQKIGYGAGMYRYNPAGMKCLEQIKIQLKALIDAEPAYRSF